MSTRVKTPEHIEVHVSIFVLGGRRHHTTFSTYGALPLTPKRLKLLRQLTESTEWRKQSPDKRVSWDEVEELVAKHIEAPD
jgi:hypothetical protein